MSQIQKRQILRQFRTKIVLFLSALDLETSVLVLKLMILTIIVLSSVQSFAIGTSTLPVGIYSPAFRYGQISGLDQRYSEAGSLVRLSDYKSIDFNASTLAKLNSDAQNLISTLNRFGAFNLGDSFNLGTLEVHTTPEVKYFAPVLAYGITKKWTVGFGLPVVHYKNNVRLSQSFSNISFYRSQFAGLSPALDQAMNTNIGEATQQTLTTKGYHRIDNRDQQFIADAQLVSLYKVEEGDNHVLIHQMTVNLPTGPQNNPDDLVALNSFHKFSVENTLGLARRINKYLKLVPYSSLKIALPQAVLSRVPTNEDDMLPDESSKESVQKLESPSLGFGLQSVVEFVESFTVSLDYNIGVKGEDKYWGSQGRRYDLLATKSSSRWHKVSADFTYSTIQSYFKKKSLMPMLVSLSFYDTVSGVNIERKTGQELAATFFF